MSRDPVTYLLDTCRALINVTPHVKFTTDRIGNRQQLTLVVEYSSPHSAAHHPSPRPRPTHPPPPVRQTGRRTRKSPSTIRRNNERARLFRQRMRQPHSRPHPPSGPPPSMHGGFPLFPFPPPPIPHPPPPPDPPSNI